jgi:hypothetical protein
VLLGGVNTVSKCDTKLTAVFRKLDATGGCATTEDTAAIIQWLGTAIANLNLVFAPPVRFIDNHDETVTDTETGLQWEKQVTDPTSIRYTDNVYTWSASCSDTTPDGDAYTVFLAALNNSQQGCFANHCDWRVPTIAELETIIDPSICYPHGTNYWCLDPIFGPSSIPHSYWSSTTFDVRSDFALRVSFDSYPLGESPWSKCDAAAVVRAVRGTPAAICQPTTCTAHAANCGDIPDGCGYVINVCGECAWPTSWCGGNGVPNQCGSACFLQGQACVVNTDCCPPGFCSGGFCTVIQ